MIFKGKFRILNAYLQKRMAKDKMSEVTNLENEQQNKPYKIKGRSNRANILKNQLGQNVKTSKILARMIKK